jgi:hypothetical protein
MSGLDPDLIRFYELIESVDLPVFIGGSVATSVWGEPRATLDIDLVIAAEAPDAERLLSAFPSERYYAPPVDVVRQTLGSASPGGFNIIDMTTSLKADCYAICCWLKRTRRKPCRLQSLPGWRGPLRAGDGTPRTGSIFCPRLITDRPRLTNGDCLGTRRTPAIPSVSLRSRCVLAGEYMSLIWT